jgi:hypothetical protein
MPTSERATRVLLLGASTRREPVVRSSRRMANEIMIKAPTMTPARVKTSAIMTRLAMMASERCHAAVHCGDSHRSRFPETSAALTW